MEYLNSLFKYDNKSVCGLTEELYNLYYLNYFNSNKDNVLIVTNSLYDANKIYKNLHTYTEDVYFFPMDDYIASLAKVISPDLKVKRLETLNTIKSNDKSIVVTNLTGYLKCLPSLKESEDAQLTINKSISLTKEEILNKLDYLGYTKESLVTTTGEFASRGFIIDVFPIQEEHPFRIEFFGDEIESIRIFDENTQLSLQNINELKILPFKEIKTSNKSSLYEYLMQPMTFFVNHSEIDNGFNKLNEDIKTFLNREIELSEIDMFNFDEIHVDKYIDIELLKTVKGGLSYNTKEMIDFDGNYDHLKDYVNLKFKDNTLIFYLTKEQEVKSISSLFNDYVNVGSIKKGFINIINKKVNKGFMIDDYIIISSNDIEKHSSTINYKNNLKIGTKIKDLNEIKPGDYVVHVNHGIGIYSGLTSLKRGDLIRDYLLIKYEGNDKVYVPVEKISSIYKYNYDDGASPKVNALNSLQWAKTKMKVREKIKDISSDLIALYAKRAKETGFAFKNFEEEDIFAANFEYIETSDQAKCAVEIKKDLTYERPMDRLLCGDVGFGKTEVAFRAMFKAVLNGYQVAYLCPTTLLSKQQYLSALDRFKDYPINIKLLNRFVSPKEVKETIKGINEGKVDIVIGTHKLLNDEIKYKNLGLLVVDEEQRFGVTHKEKIKSLRTDVNVLTLSATPIPRTLKMAMSGLRDLSLIDTPPVNRYPVQTYVFEENDFIIKDAIYKELTRGGQAFILFNHVDEMDEYAVKIKKLVPEARISFAHGRLDKRELEKTVSDYIDGKYDVLVCTTIIETGIDIPNVNTLIVIDADRFGLSQLYQLRGRVGRSDKIAYAYLMYNPKKTISDIAKKRLKTIEEFTELGSGYKIALKDLSIRGAGDILGSEQAGFIDAVGIDLYTQMLNEEIRKIKGEEVIEETLDRPLIEVSNHIADEYVSDESIKIEIHKLINEIESKESLDKIKSEIEDRFGKIHDDLIIYMYEEWFEKLALKLHITNVENNNKYIEIELPPDISEQINGEKLFFIVNSINQGFRLSYKMKRIYIKLSKLKLDKHFIYYEIKLLEEIINMVKIIDF